MKQKELRAPASHPVLQPGGVQGASAAGFKGALALAEPTTRRRQSNADAGSLKPGWDRRRGPGNQTRAPTQGL